MATREELIVMAKQKHSRNELIAKAKQKYESEKAVDNDSGSVSKEKQNKLESALIGAAQGATLGYAPQIAGVTSPVATGLLRLLQSDVIDPKTGKPIPSKQLVPSESYIQARDRQSDLQKQAATENPWSYYGGNIAGGIAPGLLIPGSGTSKTVGDALKQGAKIGGLSGLIQNPGDIAGEVSPLQLDARLVGAGLGAGLGGVLSAGGNILAQKANASRLAERLRERPQDVQDELRGLLDETSENIRQKVIVPAEADIQAAIKGKTVQLNPDLIPSNKSSPVTGRQVLGGLKQRLINRATADVPVDAGPSSFPVNYEIGQQTQLPLMNVSPPTVAGKILQNAEGQIVPELTRNVPAVQLAQTQNVGQKIEQQLPLSLKDQAIKRVQGLTADVPAEDVRRLIKVSGRMAEYPDATPITQEIQAQNAPWENIRDIARRKLGDVAPDVEAPFAKQAEAFDVLSKIKRQGGGARRPISEFTSKDFGDVAAELGRADDLLQTTSLRDTLGKMGAAADYNKPLNIFNALPQIATQYGPGIAGKLSFAGKDSADAAYKALLAPLVQEKLRALNLGGNKK